MPVVPIYRCLICDNQFKNCLSNNPLCLSCPLPQLPGYLMLPIPESLIFFFSDSFFSIVHFIFQLPNFSSCGFISHSPVLLGSYLQTVKKSLYCCFNIQEVRAKWSKVSRRCRLFVLPFPSKLKRRLHALSCRCPNFRQLWLFLLYAIPNLSATV